MSKKNLFVGISAFAALFGGVYAFSNYLYNLSAIPTQRTDEDTDFHPDITSGRMFVRNNANCQDMYIDAIDEIRLHACFIPSTTPSDKYVILIHGIWDNHESNGIYAKHYLDKGFNCLLPDLRGFGLSEGNYVGYGLDDRLDIMEWIYWIIKRNPKAEIILHGMSMGAATTLMTTGENLPENVKGAVSDSSYSSLTEQFLSVYKYYLPVFVPKKLTLAILRYTIILRAGFDIKEVSPVEAVARSKTPTLFIHCDDDKFVSPSMCSKLYEAANPPKQYCMILGAGHIEGVVHDPDNYWGKIDGFIEKVFS